ncbi:MAG: amino acid adenylation domain-containing protein [Acidobacteriia bacterium]|nr:amino acid adenylation domain-containing protein [Terriglobia bacterium]
MTSTAQLQVESPEGFRVSPQQRRLWGFIQQNPQVAFCAQCHVRITGPLSAERLDEAIRSLRSMHEILRTRFVVLPGTKAPVQVIGDVAAGLNEQRSVALESAVESIAEVLRDQARYTAADSGVNFTLLHVSDELHSLLVTSSGLCADATALVAMIRQLRNTYSSDPLEGSETLQYADISEWQNQILEGEAKKHDCYWKVADFSELRFPHLPFERRNSESVNFTPGVLVRDFTNRISLSTVTRQAGAPTEAVLFAIYQLLISRLSSLEQFLIGVTVDGRTPAELRDAIGLFAKPMPVAATLEQDQTFVQFVQKVSTALELARYEQAYFDAETFLSAESPQRCRLPLVFNVSPATPLPPVGTIDWEITSLEERLEPFELMLTVDIENGYLKALKFAWNKSIFDEQEITFIAEYYTDFLSQVTADPARSLRDFTLSSAMVSPLLVAKSVEESAAHGVYAWIEEQCARVPQRVAAVCGDQQITYAELNRRAALLAARLRKIGAAPDTVIAIVAQRSLDFIVAIFAVLKSGAAWLPVDPDTPAERIKYMIAQSAAIAALVENGTDPAWQRLNIPIIHIDEPHGDTNTVQASEIKILPEQLAYVIFTSGSTGNPKGVAIEHRQLMAYVRALRADLDLPDGASYALVSTMAADLGHTPVFAALTSGGCLHVIPSTNSRDMTALAEYFQRTPVECIKIVPAHLQALCQAFPAEATFSCRVFVVGGEPLTWELTQMVQKIAPGCRVVNEYGPTETTVGVIAASAKPEKECFNTAEAPIGWPRAGVSAYVLDQSLTAVPAWVPGDLYIGGNHVGRGYIGATDLTAERFLPDPFQSIFGARMYLTGDRARRRSDGALEFLGRTDGQVKVRGYRIELSEVEAVLCRHPHVQAAIAMVIPDKNGGKLLAAWVAVGQDKVLPQELRRFVSDSLPSYMVPNVFTCVDRFKLTPNGKVDRRGLSPAAEPSGGAGVPVDEIEENLLAVWRKVLGKESVNVDDNYFVLGGDSLRVIQVVHEARRYGISIRAMDVLRCQTIRSLRKALQQERRYELFPDGVSEALLPELDISLLPSDVIDFYPISGIQTFVLQKYAENQGADGIYHIQECFHLEDQNFSRDLLEAAFKAVINRHPILRTVFYLKSSPPLQCVRSALPWKIITTDISHLDGAAQDAYIADQVKADRISLFDPANMDAPLFRIVVFLRSATQFSVLFSCHHAIMDGWGHQIFLNHLLQAYADIKSGRTPDLGSPDGTYHEFVNFEHAVAHSEQAAKFWRSYLRDVQFPPLPDFVLPALAETNDPIVISKLEPEQNQALERIAQQHAVSMQALLLAAWLELLRQWSGGPVVTTGVISNGRSEYLADPLSAVGLFWNVAPVVSRKKLPLLEQAEIVQKDLIDIQPYASYPLTELINDNGGQELFYSAFRYLNFWNSKEIPEESGLRFVGAYVVDRYPFALTCTAATGPDGRYIQLEYNSKSISLGFVKDLLSSYKNLLGELTQTVK